jgi:hypothetical protein
MCALATACGSAPAPSAAPAARAVRHPSATEAGNRNLADAEARKLLSTAPVRAGAVPLGTAPKSLSVPAMGLPGAQSLADDSRSWRLQMPFHAAAAWLARHRPPGLPRDGVSGIAAPIPVQPPGQPPFHPPGMAGYSYSGPANAAWASAELDVEVAPAGPHSSVLRADGLVIWLDPVPVPDSVVGKRMRVLVRGGCPSSDASVVGVTNPGARLVHSLLPSAQPSAALTCRYDGGNGHPFSLASHQLSSAKQARRLAASMERIPLGHIIGGGGSCPLDDGSAEVVAFSYPGGRADVDLWISVSGCGGVSNGYIRVG